MLLCFCQSCNTRELFSLKKLERSTSTSTNVTHTVAKSSLIDSSDAITPSNNCSCTTICCGSHKLSHSNCSSGKWFHLEHTHWSVENNGIAISYLFLE